MIRRASRPSELGVLIFSLYLIMLTVVGCGGDSAPPPLANPGSDARITVDGPIMGGIHGWPFNATVTDIAQYGYVEEEFFFSGYATGGSASDGAVLTEPYRSRMLVRRPVDPAEFNGTVVVEWLNVSIGFDMEVEWPMTCEYLMREGYAWVGVKAQPLGVDLLKEWDRDRYGSLMHPGLPTGPPPIFVVGESFSDDIFSQAGKALLGQASGADPMGGLRVEHLIAFGHSQSSNRLTLYANNRQAEARIYDAFLLHGGGDTHRVNAIVPTIRLNAETEVIAHYPFRQGDSEFYRLWEVSGTGHYPASHLEYLSTELNRDLPGQFDIELGCDYAPQMVLFRYVASAALHSLNQWITEGIPAPSADPITVIPGTPDAIARDAYGNAIGGIRPPQMAVPIGRNMPYNSPGPWCADTGGFDLFDGEPAGTTPADEWDEPVLDQLYDSHDAYVSAVIESADALVKSGFMLEADAEVIKGDALHASIPR